MYSQCSINYYMQAVGNNFQSVSGLLNLSFNFIFRVWGCDIQGTCGNTTASKDMDALSMLERGLTDKNDY